MSAPRNNNKRYDPWVVPNVEEFAGAVERSSQKSRRWSAAVKDETRARSVDVGQPASRVTREPGRFCRVLTDCDAVVACTIGGGANGETKRLRRTARFENKSRPDKWKNLIALGTIMSLARPAGGRARNLGEREHSRLVQHKGEKGWGLEHGKRRPKQAVAGRAPTTGPAFPTKTWSSSRGNCRPPERQKQWLLA